MTHSLLQERRFVPCHDDGKPRLRGWKEQKYWSDHSAAADIGPRVQFVLGDGWIGRDFDDVIGPDGIHPDIQAIIDEYGDRAYVERSKSGRGVHIICRCDGQQQWRGRNGSKQATFKAEFYPDNKLFVLTGDLLNAPVDPLPDMTDVTDALYRRFWPDTAKQESGEFQVSPTLSDEQVTARARSKYRAFAQVFDSGTHPKYTDRSEVRRSLLRMLVFFTQDVDQLERLLEASSIERRDERPDCFRYEAERIVDACKREGWKTYKGGILPASLGPAAYEINDRFERASIGFGSALNDDGNAIRFVDACGGLMFFCSGAWYIWDGTRFVPDDNELILQYARVVPASLSIEAERRERKAAELEAANGDVNKDVVGALLETARRARQFALRAGNRRVIQDFLKLASADPVMRRTADELDSHPELFNCPNGVVNLRTGELLPHDKALLQTHIAGVEYDPSASHPEVERFVRERFNGDEEQAQCFQKAVGVSVTGYTHDHLFVGFGEPGTGKSSLLAAIVKATGSYADGSMPCETFAREKAGKSTHDELLHLVGKRVIMVSEIRPGTQLDAELLCRFASGEAHTARGIFKTLQTWDSHPTIWFFGNADPRFGGNLAGLRRRLIRFVFRNRLNKDYRKILSSPEVQPALLKWIVDGARLYLADGLSVPKVIEDDTAELFRREDPLPDFMDESLRKGGDAWGDELFHAFETWCENNGYPCRLNASALQHAVLERFGGQRGQINRGGKNKRGIKGVSVVPQGDI